MSVYHMLEDEECDRQNRWDVEKEQWTNYEHAFMSDEASVVLFHCTGCSRSNSHIWMGHCSDCGGSTVMGGVSLVSCGLAIFR